MITTEPMYLARTMSVRPHHDRAPGFEVAWGEGWRRESFVTDSAGLASALAVAPRETTFGDEVRRLMDLLGVDTPAAEELVNSLRAYGLFRTAPDDISAAEERWLDVAWSDALDFHLATRDAKWVHDYTGNPKVMTRYFVDHNVQPDSPPPPRYPAPHGEAVPLPATKRLGADFDAAQARRRTSRHFVGTSVDLADVATVLDWTFAPRWPEGAPELHATQTYSRGAPFVAYVLFAGEGAPAEVRRDFAAYQYDPTGRQLVYRSSANIATWSELLWQQDYADGAPMMMLVCADWIQYYWKYRMSRAYRFVYTECGAFMQTALTVATALGLRSFQTPAVNDRAFSELIGVDDADVGPLYVASFGRPAVKGQG
jgi:hypothetical protein